jgi:hypothetical protein
MRKLLSEPDVSSYLERTVGLSGQKFMAASMDLLDGFRKDCVHPEASLLSLGDPADTRIALKHLSADRAKRQMFHKSKLQSDDIAGKPYELNTLLRFPIIKDVYQFFAPYPELIGYASTRGLFFRLSEKGGESFRGPFARALEIETADMLRTALPVAEILTEEDERKMGCKGKTNDVTLIVADNAILIECKLSGLFVEAKRTASSEAIIADVKKRIADDEDRRGLFQLHDKIEAVRSRTLPAPLLEKYRDVKRFFPVLLLFDAIEHANAPMVIGNIIKDELLAHGVVKFDYQIWHIEELSWMIEFAGSLLMDWIIEKFSPKHYELELNTFIADKLDKSFLRPPMYMPSETTRAYDILKRASAIRTIKALTPLHQIKLEPFHRLRVPYSIDKATRQGLGVCLLEKAFSSARRPYEVCRSNDPGMPQKAGKGHFSRYFRMEPDRRACRGRRPRPLIILRVSPHSSSWLHTNFRDSSLSNAI